MRPRFLWDKNSIGTTIFYLKLIGNQILFWSKYLTYQPYINFLNANIYATTKEKQFYCLFYLIVFNYFVCRGWSMSRGARWFPLHKGNYSTCIARIGGLGNSDNSLANFVSMLPSTFFFYNLFSNIWMTSFWTSSKYY